MQTIGFVGTAKNTGKTTTALHILDLVSKAGIQTALTSIGYDGENLDHVTGLPKPRYFAQKGILIATAERCLGFGTAEYTDIINTGLRTIMGDILIATVREPGYVVLAGPNRRIDIKILLARLNAMGVELTMIDGALNRLAALTLADGLVLSTGAAYNEQILPLADHAAAMESLFQYPQTSYTEEITYQNVTLVGRGGETDHLQVGSIFEESDMHYVIKWFEKNHLGTCIIPGVIYPVLFQKMLGKLNHQLKNSRFVFFSPLNLLATGSPEIWRSCFSDLAAYQCEINYLLQTQLYFMTVNPFYPRYLQKTGNYVAAFVDKTELLAATRQLIKKTPVVDILQPPHPDFLSLWQIYNH